ncbi:MAG TPA: bifunctional protein-serine/threonine kinase/phosphatase [Noviherbaspirillum sp.]|jgi:serine/threonine protein phosphatase PrpC|uniref:bifunctional protein-serine/threonine kinase/phosphatase n=1 Tax=Noviherbaspirillum sp. TaxID=1926288 RepID=UPI002DDCB5CE|nr:bifunctional protein-serine/threonine kinase/phosphatase [Noviherbaspirillum sp.]HEV2609193.1 bifunctional protein-serine/threonine kinase/phosphatase [Noviherbaspirillum sp.]
MPLTIAAGHATLAGPRERNEDFVGMVTPDQPELSTKGLIAAIADGVSGNDGGREAAEYTVRGLLADYYATPDTWPVTQALDRVIKAINGWVQKQGSARRELAGMATTLTSVVLRGGFYYFSHVGDTRLYLLRGGALTRLTTDHVWDRPEMQHVLTRAIGLDSRLAIDHGMGELRERDVFLLASDGVWAWMTEYDITSLLSEVALGRLDADSAAAAMVETAQAGGSTDNSSALVLQVLGLPEENLRDALSLSQQLPALPKLRTGQSIDGMEVEALVHSSRATLLYRVVDPRTQRRMALKTLQPEAADDPRERSAFAHEEWLAKRVVARFFPQVIAPEQKNFLYYLTTWHDGYTVQQRLDEGAHFTVPEVIAHGEKLVRAVGALHRRSIIHRDIKPANVHLGIDGELRLLDLGVAHSGLEAENVLEAPQAGTPSFLAPEQFAHEPPSPQTDVYAAGVTLYLMLTRRYPYGEIEPFQNPRFGDPVPPSRYRPDVPVWLENVVLKAVARDPSDRFETAEEFLLALERGAANPLPGLPATPLAKRDPLSLWRAVAVMSIVMNLLLLYLIVVG